MFFEKCEVCWSFRQNNQTAKDVVYEDLVDDYIGKFTTYLAKEARIKCKVKNPLLKFYFVILKQQVLMPFYHQSTLHNPPLKQL